MTSQGRWALSNSSGVIPVVFTVINNQPYAAVVAAQRRYGSVRPPDALPCKDLSGPHLATIAGGFGIASWRASSVPELREALAAAFATEGPTVVEAMTSSADLGPSAVPGTI